ncbi:hypothetical protein TNCV_1806031, partial [Trichonephila clavipes]
LNGSRCDLSSSSPDSLFRRFRSAPSDTPTLNFYNSGTANREVTHSILPTNHSACFLLPVHSKHPLVSSLRLRTSILLRPTTTPSTTSLQPTNQKHPTLKISSPIPKDKLLLKNFLPIRPYERAACLLIGRAKLTLRRFKYGRFDGHFHPENAEPYSDDKMPKKSKV